MDDRDMIRKELDELIQKLRDENQALQQLIKAMERSDASSEGQPPLPSYKSSQTKKRKLP